MSEPPPVDPAESANVLWFLPTHGDGRYLGAAEGARETSLPYLRQIAQAVDELGYYGALLPTGRSCDDSWVIASALAPMTQRMRFLVAVRPGLQSPAMAARMAATLDRISGGRLLINVVAGGDPVELKGDGIFLDHTARYDVTAEFLEIWRRMMEGETVNYQGRHLQVEDARLFYPALQQPYPPLYFGGSSDAGMAAAADHIDLYLTWGEPPADVGQKLARMKAVAAARGREVRFGLRVHVIVRDTAEAAWRAADELISRLDDATIAKAQAVLARMDSVGQQRMARLHSGSRGQLEVSPNLWAGVGLVRGGAGTALVGDPDTVAHRMREYMEVGVDTFILSGYPHLEECYRFAELVFPRLPLAAETGRPAAAVTNEGPFGERVANHLPPVPRVAAH